MLFWISVFVVCVYGLSLLIITINLPDWVKKSCPKCGGNMKWIKGCGSQRKDEALFKCKKCNHLEYRGGFGSELLMELKEFR